MRSMFLKSNERSEVKK